MAIKIIGSFDDAYLWKSEYRLLNKNCINKIVSIKMLFQTPDFLSEIPIKRINHFMNRRT